MSGNFQPQSDAGILFYGSNNGSGSYTKINGTAGTVRTITNANYVSSEALSAAGRRPDLRITVSGTISAGMASAIIIVEGRRTDRNNTVAENWKVLGTTRGDSPSVAAAATQTITRANLVGQSVADGIGGGAATETLDVVLLTTDHRQCDELRVIVKATNAPESGDVIVVAVNG